MELGSVTPPAVPVADAQRRRRRRVALLILLALTAGGVWRGRPHAAVNVADDGSNPSITSRPKRIVPDSVRIKVEVVNATATRGLGRLATAWLRDQGFDVVSTITAAEKDRRDTTLVLDRSGHPAWAALAATAIGGARVESRPDSLRYLDLSILVGRSWRPPPQSLYP